MAKKKKKEVISPIDEKLPQTEAELSTKEVAKSVKESTTEDTLVKETKVPDGFTKTTPVAGVVKDAVGISGVTGAFSEGSYGGKRLDGAGSAQSLPGQGNSARSDTRVGKKLDSTVKKINSIVSEQVVVQYKESTPINEAKGPQGYAGRYVDPHLRLSKVNGAHPGDILFDRSVDEITRDELNFIEGQYVSVNDEALMDHFNKGGFVKCTSAHEYAIKLETDDDVEKYSSGVKVGSNWVDIDGTALAKNNYVRPLYRKGNYVLRQLAISIDKNDQVVLSVVEDNIRPDGSLELLNRASQSALTFSNRTELDRQAMETKAGDENENGWSPLGRAVPNPTGLNNTLRSIEADVGSTIFAAISKGQIAHSYQINKAFKDGQRHDTIGEMLNNGDVIKKSGDAPDRSGVFSKEQYSAGNASLFIDMYDSIAKYNTRADVLTQPRSLKMHLSTALHYAKQLKVYEPFVKRFKHDEAFSFMGENYDPFLPVLITDAEAEVHSISWSDFVDASGRPRALKYSYGNVRNNLTQSVYHPIIKAIYDWANDYKDKLKAKLNNKTVAFRPIHGTKFISGWDMLMSVVTPYVVKNRIQSFHDVIEYEVNHNYPYSGFISLEEALAVPYKNFSFNGIEEPLTAGRMNDALAYTWTFPEIPMYLGKWDPTVGADDNHIYMMPFYMSDASYIVDRRSDGYIESVEFSDTPSISMPSIRSGVVLSVLDSLYSVDERDLRLTYDMMVALPAMSELGAKNAFLSYQYGVANDGIPVVGYSNPLTIGDILKTPRELGYDLVVPADYLRISPSQDNPTRKDLTSDWFGDTSYIAYVWNADIEIASDILSEPTQLTGRGSAFIQSWTAYAATKVDLSANSAGAPILGFNSLFDVNGDLNDDILTVAVPFTDDVKKLGLTGSATKSLPSKGFGFITLASVVWPVIQRIPMALSPFDYIVHTTTTQNKIKGNIDPFEKCYWLGMAGFRASDYTEDLNNRIVKRSVEGITYTEDLFDKEGPIQ